MSAFNGAGTFVISGVGLPFVPGTTISSTVANQLNNDLAAGLTNCITKDGQTTPTANIPLGGFKLTGVGAPTAPGDALVFGQPATVGNLTVTGNATISGTLSVPGGITAPGVSGANKIINGDMMINQWQGGGAVPLIANISQFPVDRWKGNATQTGKLTVQQGLVTTLPGFSTYLKMLSTSSYAVVAGDYFIMTQNIEGYNCQDLSFGTAGAKTITLSFWANCSLTGQFGGIVSNSAVSRSYPFLYTINAANTWEYKTITIPGDTIGTWLIDNGIGLILRFSLGVDPAFRAPPNAWTGAGYYFSAIGETSIVAVNGAYLNITGVKLEISAVATPFVEDNYEVSLAKCQRYYWKDQAQRAYPSVIDGGTGDVASALFDNPVNMRVTPSGVFVSHLNFYYNNGASIAWNPGAGGVAVVGNTGGGYIAKTGVPNPQGVTQVNKTGYWNAQLAFDAEL